jgi:predicted nucleotidyltransferase
MAIESKDMAVIHRSRPKISLLDFTKEQVLDFLRERLSGHEIEHAYLFGSFAGGEITAWSDIDLIVVKNTSVPFVERPREFSHLFDLGVPFDILVYTPEEWAKLQTGDTGFFKVVRSQLQKIV